jgi:hypothetical protein
MRFARVIFGLAGVYGLILILPMYFEIARFERAAPPVITHLELYYGFVGVTIAWQVAFLITVTLAFGTADLLWGALFVVAYVRAGSGADQQST